MLYKSFQGTQLSALGFGAMRLPTIGDGRDAPIDEAEATRIIAYAHENGINYFDTAYMYHHGESERVLGRALKQFAPDTYYLATKFPGHEILQTYDVKSIFEDQLKKCGVEHFGFYLLHNVYEKSIENYLDPQLGIMDYLLEQKRIGRIGHLGFSCHGRLDTLKQFLDVYGDRMEFCQIQLNYLDWTLQDAKSKYALLSERGIPVWVMEPVRGGRLASLSSDHERELKTARPDESIAAWAFRWLQTLPNVHVVLSGMTKMEQVEDNSKTYSTEKPLTAEELKILDQVAASMLDLLPCTACRYCCSACPQELDIPNLLALYNECRFEPSFVARMAVDAMDPEKRPSACIGCGTCNLICPQNIDIPEALKQFQAILDKLPRWGAPPKTEQKEE